MGDDRSAGDDPDDAAGSGALRPATRKALAGAVVAAIGFVLTRFAVAETAAASSMFDRFLAVEAVSMVGGFALATFGVILAVSTFSPMYVRTVAVWTVAGTASMVVVVGLSTWVAAGATLPNAVVVNAVLAGAVGGTITGVRSAETDVSRRDLVRKNDELQLLNRMLRDRVLNAAAIIDGEASLAAETDDGAERLDAIRATTDRIEAAIEEVKVLVESDPTDRVGGGTDLVAAFRETVDDRSPDTPAVSVASAPEDCPVDVGPDVAVILDRFLTLVAERATGPITATVDADATTARLRLRYEGAGLSEDERRVVERDRVAEFDSPSVDFGLSLVAVLVGRYGGHLAATAGPPRSLTLALPRTDGTPTWSASRAGRTGLAPRQLRNIGVAAVVAGLLMGAVMSTFTGAIPVIGSLYGVPSPAVGWLSHLFHSLVFGLGTVAVLERWDADWVASPRRRLGFGAVVGVGLWLVAAGLVMPAWLRLVGTGAPLPNLSGPGLVGHLLWGVALVWLYDLLPNGR